MNDFPIIGMIITCLIANVVFIHIKNPILWLSLFIFYASWILFLLKLAS